MFTYSSDQTVIPSLSFSKAELLYAALFLLKDIANSDTSTKIEMVEMRHYLNQIKDKVLLAAYNGSLNRIGIETPPESTEAPEAKKTAIPSISDLKAKFPTLSEEEIREILDKAAAEGADKDVEGKCEEQQPPPSFVSKKLMGNGCSNKPQEQKPDKDRENSKKFASMLGL